MKILFYVDSAVAYGHCVSGAEMLRRKLDAQIVLMSIDSQKYLNATTQAYELYDYSSLVRPETGFVRTWPKDNQPVQARSSRDMWKPIRALWSAARRVNRSVFRRLKALRDEAKDFRFFPSSPRLRSALGGPALVALLPAMLICRALVIVIFRLPGIVISRIAEMLYRFARLCGLVDDAELVPRNVPLGHRDRVAGVYPLPSAHPVGGLGLRLRNGTSSLRARLTEAIGDAFRQPARLLVTHQTIGRFLDKVEPDLIVLAEENVETLSSTFVAQGSRRQIPTIILPSTLPNPLEPAQFHKDSVDHRAKGLIARLLCAFWPKWRFTYEGSELLRLPAPTALLAELLGVSSPDPWILNRGKAAAIALDSRAQRDQYLRLGFPASQLHVVGDANGDTLYQSRRNRNELLASLFGVHGFDAGKPLVLCAFPPDQYDIYDPAAFEFADYPSLVNAWTSVFRELNEHANFLVRPHPRASATQIEFLRSHGVEISMQPTAELIPLCDIYLASISATIRWAIACGIPVINYDTYRYRYGDFDSAAGVLQVESVEDFRRTLRRLSTDPEFLAEARSKQQASMEYWGFSDGKTADRLAGVALEVVGATRRLSGS